MNPRNTLRKSMISMSTTEDLRAVPKNMSNVSSTTKQITIRPFKAREKPRKRLLN
jgi:hypothetical protein